MNTTTMQSCFDQPQERIDQAAKVLLVLSLFWMPISTAATNVFMGLALIAWLLSGGYKVRWESLRSNTFAWAVAGLFLLMCIGIAWSTGSIEDILYQLHKNAKLLFMLPAITLLQEEKWRRRGLIAFGAAMLLTLALSLLSIVWALPFGRSSVDGLTGSHNVFRDYIAQNLMMSFFALVLVAKSRFDNKRSNRWVYGLLALLSVIDIVFFVQGRTGYVSLAFNAIVFVVLSDGWRQRIITAAMVGVIALLTISFSTKFKARVDLAVQEYRAQDEMKLTSVGQRVEFAKKGWQLMGERPLFGFGTGSYKKEFCRVAETKEWCAAGNFHPHNQFLSFGVQLGALGLLAYLAFLFVCIKQAWTLPPAQKIMSTGLVATLIADSMFHAPLFLISEAAFFILMFPVFMAIKPDLASLPEHSASAN